jgi:hypothetical protein
VAAKIKNPENNQIQVQIFLILQLKYVIFIYYQLLHILQAKELEILSL